MRNIVELIHTFSCELMLADSGDRESLSSLLPVLKKIHSQCMKAGLRQEARKVLNARKKIEEALRPDTVDRDSCLRETEAIMNELSATVYEMEDDARSGESLLPPDEISAGHNDPDTAAATSPGTKPSEADGGGCVTEIDLLEEKLDELKILLGSIGNDSVEECLLVCENLEGLGRISETIEPDIFHSVAMACRDYADRMKETDIRDCRPLEESLSLMKAMASHLKRREPFIFDYSDVMKLLKMKSDTEQAHEDASQTMGEAQEKGHSVKAAPEKISEDDLEIYADFISEAEENLDAIEVRLIDLEQDPDNGDIINDIFRPFHTIKGVSGFLSLTKINKLSHATENLLDSARSGEISIDQEATDAILKAVDTLKRLIDRVRQGTRTGFVEPDDDIDVDRLQEKLKALQISLAGENQPPLGEILVKNAVVDRQGINRALELQKMMPEKKLGEILVEEESVRPGQVASALMEQTQVKRKVDSQVKVSTQKLDDLVDYAGELVIAQSMLRQKTGGDAYLSQNVSQLGIIVTKMQSIAMSMRMIPIKATFMKMIRLVRDLSRKSGKEVCLEMSGEDTEIDRNVVDALYEPMVHMIRNSVDHGIEQEGERNALGKPGKGTINLRAYHKGGHIIIEIEDDGKGLDRDRILQKAESTGIIDGGEQLTDAQVFDLIMEPGFSTAQKITDVSGRGVGMDVVKDGIEKFRGHLNIESERGRGTKFTISLPLTLAVIDGMLVRVDSEKYVIPTIAVQRAFKPLDDEYFTVEGRGEMVKDRGSLLPLIRLDEVYSTGEGGKNIHDCLVVVVESKDKKRAILIDELLGKDEYVIKSLGTGMEEVRGIAGGAIMADGRVGLILDIHGLFSVVSGS